MARLARTWYCVLALCACESGEPTRLLAPLQPDAVVLAAASPPPQPSIGNFVLLGCDGKPMPERRPGARVRMGCGPVTGRIAPELIHAFFRSEATTAAVSACTAAATLPVPKRVSVVFMIGRDGRAGKVRVNVPDTGLATCLVAIASSARYAPPVGGPVHVTYPLLLDG